MTKFLSLAIGTLLGGFSRYFLSGFIYRIWGTNFPFGTLIVNLTGCFMIGFLYSLSDEKFLLGPNQKLLLMVGFCGAFTTFSTFMLETANLIKGGETWHAFLNVFTSVIMGFIVFRIGIFLGEII